MDVLVTLNGTTLHSTTSASVLPYPSTAISRKLLAGAKWEEIKAGEELRWRGWAMLHTPFFPGIQRGAKLDWISEDWKDAESIWGFYSQAGYPWVVDLYLSAAGKRQRIMGDPLELWGQHFASELSFTGDSDYLISNDQNEAHYRKGDFWALVQKERFFVEWADEQKSSSAPATPVDNKLPGNWLAGRRVFFSAVAACSTCHQIRGEGIAVGPDLTNLTSRDSGSVLRDILQPSAAINPDHPASTVKLRSGATLTGIVRTASDKELKVALQAGAVQVLNPADVASVELLKTSLMPEGYAGRLTQEQQTDLLKFLLENPLEPAPVEMTAPPLPPARTQAEVAAVLGQPRPISQIRPVSPFRILLSAGPKDHGPGEHDYPLWQKRWTTLLGLAPGVTVDTSWEFPTAGQLAAADVTVFFSKNPGFNPRTAMLLDEYQQRGGGLVYLHWAIEGGEHANVLAERIGLASDSRSTRYRHGGIDLVFPQPEHPVTKGFSTLHFTDETYWNLAGEPGKINLLGTAVEEGKPQPQFWSMERGKGRVIGCIPGHYTWTFDDPLYRLLVLRAICWTGNQEDADRLAELATVGARIAP